MSEHTVNIPAFSLCPFRSPVVPPEPTKVYVPGGTPPEPQAIYGPCLYAGCGAFVVTEVADGKIKNGVCGIRALAVAAGSIAESLGQLVKLKTGEAILGAKKN